MAGKMQDANPKKRLLLFVGVAGAVVLMGFMGWRYMHNHERVGQASVAEAPKLSSTPGGGHPSEQYVTNQVEQNAIGAQEARQNAGSAVPTLTRPGFVGSITAFTDDAAGNSTQVSGSSCPVNQDKVVYRYRPNPATCAVDNLVLARKAGVTADELRCQACSCPALKAAGFTVGDLKSAGFAAKELKACGFDAMALRDAGFSATDLVNAGFSANELKDAGFSAGELKAAGMTVDALQAAGFSTAELKDAGFTASELHAAGVSLSALKAAGFSPAELQIAAMAENPQRCSVESLRKAHDAGVSAETIRGWGCDIVALKTAGFNAAELKAAGFHVDDLLKAGYSPAEVLQAGFTPKDLLAAGLSEAAVKAAVAAARNLPPLGNVAELKAAGVRAEDLLKAGYSPAELLQAGFTPQDLLAAGLSEEAVKAAVAAARNLPPLTSTRGVPSSGLCSADAIRSARNAGVSAVVLRKRGCGLAALRAGGFTAS